jgi:hypothetical protein
LALWIRGFGLATAIENVGDKVCCDIVLPIFVTSLNST